MVYKGVAVHGQNRRHIEKHVQWIKNAIHVFLKRPGISAERVSIDGKIWHGYRVNFIEIILLSSHCWCHRVFFRNCYPFSTKHCHNKIPFNAIFHANFVDTFFFCHIHIEHWLNIKKFSSPPSRINSWKLNFYVKFSGISIAWRLPNGVTFNSSTNFSSTGCCLILLHLQPLERGDCEL